MRWRCRVARSAGVPLLLGALALVGLAPAAWAAPEGPEGRAGGYAGAERCKECHEEEADGLAATMHGKQGFADLSSRGCETCHGPAAAHADDPDDEAHLPRLPEDADGRSAVCRDCHDGGAQKHWEGSRHQRRDVACTDCHGIHTFASPRRQLKAATAMETCFECHKDVRAETRKTSHHPVREGKIGCEDCHNPHGTTTPRMIRAASVNDQCYECHTEKRGPFLWEHAPVREDCLSCHAPHGSNHAKLQKTAVPYLCQQCHLNTRHPGTLYDRNSLPGAQRQSNRIFNRGCVNCHSAIHGTNHPSGPYLGR